jgi:serine/threonine protein kinase
MLCVARGAEEPSTEKLDLWALGVTAYVTPGRFFPFQAPPESAEKGQEIIAGLSSWDNPESFVSVSTEFRDFIGELLTVDPERRLLADEAMNCKWFDSLRNPDVKETRGYQESVEFMT